MRKSKYIKVKCLFNITEQERGRVVIWTQALAPESESSQYGIIALHLRNLQIKYRQDLSPLCLITLKQWSFKKIQDFCATEGSTACYIAFTETHHSLGLIQGSVGEQGVDKDLGWIKQWRKHFKPSKKSECWVKFGWGKIKDSITKRKG